jgi:hypothetical protein
LFLASTAHAEPATKLYGVVTDSEGKALPGIGISVVGPSSSLEQEASVAIATAKVKNCFLLMIFIY